MVEYKLKDQSFIKDGHTMFLEDVLKDLKRKAFLEEAYEKLMEALIPSGNTKAFHIGEYSFSQERSVYDEDGEIVEYIEKITIPWTSIKDIMKGVLDYANIKQD